MLLFCLFPIDLRVLTQNTRQTKRKRGEADISFRWTWEMMKFVKYPVDASSSYDQHDQEDAIFPTWIKV